MKKHKLVLIFTIIIFALGFFVYPYYRFISHDLGISVFKLFLPFSPVKKFNNHTNILLLGKGGIQHDGPNLTDSISLISYNFQTHALSTIGIPRDIWSSTIEEKINAAYAIGEAKKKGGGLTLAKAEISSVIGEPIHYAVVIDFDIFRTLVDFFGGIDVTVDNAFTDHQYPIEGKENDLCGGDPDYKCRYETVSFSKGLKHMDGQTALIYVRSRHAQGLEGSDFARSRRQQKVIGALEKPLKQLILKRDIPSLKKLYELVDTSIQRDLTNEQIAFLVKDIVLKKNTSHQAIDLNPDYFEVPNPQYYEGRYVLIPRNSSYESLHNYIHCKLNDCAK